MAKRSAQSGRAASAGKEGAVLACALARALGDVKSEDVRVLDVRGLTDVTDFMVIATATSERHLRALSDAATEAVRAAERRILGSEGADGSGWVIVDTGDVVVHVFSSPLRSYYDLDGLWGDAKELGLAEEVRMEAGK